MKRSRAATAAAVLSAGLLSLGTTAACTKGPAAPTVPRLSKGTGAAGPSRNADNPNAVGGDGSAARRAKLHAAAQCIREHGATQYQDPLLTADGFVYTDEPSLRGLEEPQLTAIDTACHDLITAAKFGIHDQGPPTPKVIAAGVKAAQCMREHGLPDFKDPTVDSPFVPGKGFGLDPQTLPPGGKADPTVRRALQACRSVLNEEAALSSLGSLGNA
jgi:hypothetical protein